MSKVEYRKRLLEGRYGVAPAGPIMAPILHVGIPVVIDPQTSGGGAAMSRLVTVQRRDRKKRCTIMSDQLDLIL